MARLRSRMAAAAPARVRGPTRSIESVMAAQVSAEVGEALEEMEVRTQLLVALRRRQLDLRQNIMHAATRPATARTMRPYAPASTAVARAVASDGETRAHPGVGGRHSRAGMSRWRRDLFRRTNPAPRPTSSSAGSSAMRQYLAGVYSGSGGGSSSANAREPEGLTEEQVARLPRTRVAAPTARPATAPAHDLAPQHGQRGESAQAACCICLQQMASGDEATALPCLHLFHFKCVAKWLQRKSVCPLCMATVSV